MKAVRVSAGAHTALHEGVSPEAPGVDRDGRHEQATQRTVAMKHASFQRAGNRNMAFPAIVEYPFFNA